MTSKLARTAGVSYQCSFREIIFVARHLFFASYEGFAAERGRESENVLESYLYKVIPSMKHML